MQNDPVNFVYPLGLDPQDPPPPPMPSGPLDVITTDTWTERPQVGRIFDNVNLTLEGSPSGGDVGGGGPQDPMEPVPREQERNDCLVFAGVVDILAQEATTDAEFIAKLYQQFKHKNLSYLASGFRPQFVDTGSSPNQARHAAGAIVAGYLGGVAAIPGGPATYTVALRATLSAFNSREYAYDSYTVRGAIAPGIPSTGYVRAPGRDQRADIALNGVAVPMGFALGVGQIKRNEIGNLIRTIICSPVPK